MKSWSSTVGLLSGLFLTLGGSTASGKVWQPSSGHEQVKIWPGPVPDAVQPTGPETSEPAENLVAGKPWTWVQRVAEPTITVYSPARQPQPGPAILVFPGGGYMGLAIDLEGSEVCDWLVSRGIACVLLKYRVPASGPHWEKECDCAVQPKVHTALQDAQRALGVVRHDAGHWHIDPHRIGVLGFSAGGHLVADISAHWDQRRYRAVDAADTESCRPDFAIALYPGHLRELTTKPLQLNPTLAVSARTPPTFLLQAVDDPVDPVENSLVYFIALKQAGVPVEMHLFAQGGHAFGLRPSNRPVSGWPALVEAWLGSMGITRN